MTEEKHTPGSWNVVGNPSGFAVRGRYTIAILPVAAASMKIRKNQYYNANLMAASPEMLKELKYIGHQTTITTEHFNRIQRLIVKAKGEV